jgi:hypothetical protein
MQRAVAATTTQKDIMNKKKKVANRKHQKSIQRTKAKRKLSLAKKNQPA